MKSTKILLGATAIALTSTFAHAASINVAAVSEASVFYDENNQNAWYKATSFDVGTQSVNNVGAGVFRVSGTDDAGIVENFLAFCLQPLEALTLPKTHLINNPFTQAIATNLNALATNAWALVDSSKTAAAFQMAAWEITTETAGADYLINDGFFKITGDSNGSNDAEDLAQDWLNKITNAEWTSGNDAYRILTAAGTQDLLTNIIEDPNGPPPNQTVVPLPASGMLLLGGLLGAGFMARRRKA